MKTCLFEEAAYCGISRPVAFCWMFVSIVHHLVLFLAFADADTYGAKRTHQQLGIRLTGENVSIGIGLVQYLDQSGTWSNVCVDGQIPPAVRVACHQLGYISGDYDGEILKSENASLSDVSAPQFHVSCVGFEGDIGDCWNHSEIPEKREDCTLLHVHCSLNPDMERGVRLISRTGKFFAAGLVQVYDASTNEWAFICPQKFSFVAARLVCSTFGMILQDTKSEVTPAWLTEDHRKAPVTFLDCNASTTSFEDCQLEKVDGECSNHDIINITCKNYTGYLQPPVFIAPHADYDLHKAIDVQGISSIDLEVRTCSGLKIALLTRKQFPLQDFTELDFGTTEIQLRRCMAVESCVYLGTYRYNASFGCHQWTVIHLELDNDYLTVSIRSKGIKAPTAAAVGPSISQTLNFSHTFQTTHVLLTSTSHTVTYQLFRDTGMNQCFVRSDLGEVGQQCGDAYVHKSLCYSCGCCFSSQAQPSCYRPTGLESSMKGYLRCYRTAFQFFGRVSATTTAPGFTKRPIFIAVIMQRITPNIRLTVDFGNQTIKTYVPTKRNETELPSWVAEKLDSFYDSGVNYVYVLKHIYNTSGKHNAVVTITDPGIVKPPTNISITLSMDVETLQPLKQIIGLFYLLNNGPSCAKCTLSLIVLSQGLTGDCMTTVDPGDGSGPQVVEMQLRGVNSSEWVAELMKQLRILISLDMFYSGLLDHSYNTSGQFMAEAIMVEPDRDKKDFLSAKTIITVDLRPHLTPIIGTVALFNNGPVYQGQNYSLLLVIEHLTPNAKVVICEDSKVLFPDLIPESGLELPAWARDEVIQYPLIGNRTDYLMLKLIHTFFSSGAHVLEARVWDEEYDDVITIHTEVIILQLPCDSRELKIRGGGGVTRESSLKLKQKDFVKLSIDIDLDCNVVGSLIYSWTASYVEAHMLNNLMGKQIHLPQEAIVTMFELYIPPFVLDVGYYLFQFKLTIPTNNAQGYILAFNQTWVQITYSPRLSLYRIGIVRKVAGLDSTITLDAKRLLKINENDISTTVDDDNITYTWFCTPEGVSLPGSHLIYDSFPESGGCFGSGLKLPFNDPVLVFKTDQLMLNQTSLPAKFKFHVFGTQPGGASPQSASHELTVIADFDPAVRIECFSNCPPKINIKEELVLEAACYKNCRYGEIIKYEWQFNPASTKNMKREINWETETNGKTGTSLIVKANVFSREAQGESYSFVIIATKPNGLMGSESFSVNIPVEIGASMERSDAITHHFFCSTTKPFWMIMIVYAAKQASST